ncbi:hypothetical protein JKF63_01772 [Porcisia hertigi]|uniref:ABC3 transporter permease C-terminal domain-containing protein n=1 Tax=Porcisia hertigi TaxID=2761500 RepID=A0A836L496_9TRYP|nr:hypothetical protein JKF63_01772 [Porcisia hertigi]
MSIPSSSFQRSKGREPFLSLHRSPISVQIHLEKESSLQGGTTFGHNAEASQMRGKRSSLDGTNVHTGLKNGVLDDTDTSTPFTRESAAVKQVPLQRSGRVAVDVGFDDDGLSTLASLRLFMHNMWLSLKMIRLFLSLAWTDMKTRTCSYVLGFFSVVVVVLLCVVVISLLEHMPILFLSISEAGRGEFDLQIWPSDIMGRATGINYTRIRQLYPESDPDYGYSAPRFVDMYTAVPLRFCAGKTVDTLWAYANGSECYTPQACMEVCTGSAITYLTVIAIDTQAEARMGFGTDYNEPTPKRNELVLSRRAAIAMGNVAVGETVILYGNAQTNMELPFTQVPWWISPYTMMPFKVISIMEKDDLKFPGMETFVVVSLSSFIANVAAGLGPYDVSPTAREIFTNTDIHQCASTVYFKMNPKFRLRAYSSTSYNTIRRNVLEWTSKLLSPVGFMQLNRATVHLSGLYHTRLLGVFLGLVVSIILLALGFLSTVLIYSLLTVGIETKTYELGIHRMVGFTKENLVMMVLINAYAFTVPAWIVGIGIGQGVYAGARAVFLRLVNMELPLLISGASVGWATLAGLGIPLVASFFPIILLVTRQLSDALNTSRSRSVGVISKVIRGDSTSWSWTMLSLGVVFFIAGFLVYYLLPTALIEKNLSLMFYIFFGLLVGLLGGLVLLFLNFERVAQTCLSQLLLFWESKAVRSLLLKSLSAHRFRNRKTTLMFALSLAFIIFITVSVNIVILSSQYQQHQETGCEIWVMPNWLTMEEYWAIEMVLEAQKRAGLITAYTYDYRHPVVSSLSNTKISSLGRYRTARSTLKLLPPNYFDVLDKRFLYVDRAQSIVGRYGLLPSLYTTGGLCKGILSSGAAKSLGLGDADGVSLIEMRKNVNATLGTLSVSRSSVRPLATLDAAPVVSVSKYKTNTGDLLVSIPGSLRCVGAPRVSVLDGNVPVIRLRAKSTADHVRIGDELTEAFAMIRHSASVATLKETTSGLATASRILNLFFLAAEMMVLMICFFALMGNMTANVLNSSKEIGVLLCMGMSHFQVYRVYGWEAFILVLSAGVMGLTVGTVVAYTMSLQNNLLSQLNLPFPFPYLQLGVVLGMGFFFSLASSISPVMYLLSLPSIKHILRLTVY